MLKLVMPILLKSKKAPKEVAEITVFSIYSSNCLSSAFGIRFRMILKQFETQEG
jgi:hypothetical protein